ncbi:hypothetical protein Btru_029111 [Bulinus truncatus]|nr:hypothetical protein Btru_029111 [Bulinus truncatus]
MDSRPDVTSDNATKSRNLAILLRQLKLEPVTALATAFLTKVVYTQTHRRLQNSFMICYIFISAIACLPVTASTETCSVKLIRYTFRYRNCVPQQHNGTSCNGTCRSYAMNNRGDLTLTQSSCTCCQALTFFTKGLAVNCPVITSDGGQTMRRVFLRVKLPKSCMCRPCTFETPVRSSELGPPRQPIRETHLGLTLLASGEEPSSQVSPAVISEDSFAQVPSLMVIDESNSSPESIDSAEE